MDEAERQFLVKFIQQVDDAANDELTFERLSFSFENIKEVRILVQAESNSIH